MNAQIIGIEHVKFDDKKTNEVVQFDKLHCVKTFDVRDTDNGKADGASVFVVNTKLTVGQHVQLGKMYEFYYEPNGKGIAVLKGFSMVADANEKK